MGTNYYVKLDVCKSCGRPIDTIHLGKSSAGWKFMFQCNNNFYKDIKSLKEWLKSKVIENEYGEKISKKDFWNMVKIKQKEKAAGGTEHGLIIIDGYDFYDREFS